MYSSAAALVILLMSGCSGNGQPSADPALGVSPNDDPVLLVGDIRHLVDRSIQEHDVAERALSVQSVQSAYARFRRDVRPLLFDRERRLLLAAEYHFGMLESEVGKRRGDPEPHAARVRAALDAAEAMARQTPKKEIPNDETPHTD